MKLKNLWINLGCFLTGWNTEILNSSTEASYKQLKKYVSALSILIILWSLIGYSFAQRYIHAPWWGCLITAIIFVVIIIQIERQIILTVGTARLMAVFRFIIALIMAVLGSAIIDQIIFKEDIEKKMIEIVDRQVKELLPLRVSEIDHSLQKLQTEIDSLQKRNTILNEDISKTPMFETVSSVSTSEKVKTPDGRDSTVHRTTTTKNQIPNLKIVERDYGLKRIETVRGQTLKYDSLKWNVEENLRTELKSKQGFLEELRAMIEIVLTRVEALVFYIVLFLFLMSLELFVVFSKIGDTKCDYDMIVEYQLNQKKKTLDLLSNKKIQ
ncbi:MAG: DUF4407 domain-containing protein [Prevotellaceae bacterium]|jgi:hypothetical protein|nr:DUF4407 domain-containing protein [Prevotellaceae bacterium]